MFCFEYVFWVVVDLVPFQDSQECGDFRRPFGTLHLSSGSLPQVETWGYLPSSLRDVGISPRHLRPPHSGPTSTAVSNLAPTYKVAHPRVGKTRVTPLNLPKRGSPHHSDTPAAFGGHCFVLQVAPTQASKRSLFRRTSDIHRSGSVLAVTCFDSHFKQPKSFLATRIFGPIKGNVAFQSLRDP